jgi:hypothetical protein
MPDTNEERLLGELLADIAQADADLAAPDGLRARVMAQWDARNAQPAVSRRSPTGRPLLIAGWAALAVVGTLALAVFSERQPSSTVHESSIDPPGRKAILETATPRPRETASAAVTPLERPVVGGAAVRRGQAAVKNEVVRFVPLVPMTGDELSGPFSIARVQIGQTETEVLLGEDGMARAIRVSADGSASWRLR